MFVLLPTDVLPSHGHLNGHGRTQRQRRYTRGLNTTGGDHGGGRHGGAPAEYTLGPSRWQKKWLTFRLEGKLNSIEILFHFILFSFYIFQNEHVDVQYLSNMFPS
jgi:hypothetical protein